MDKQLQCTICNDIIKNDVLWEKHMKSEKHIAGLKFLKEKLKSGDLDKQLDKSKIKVEQPKEVKQEEEIVEQQEVRLEPQSEKIKENIKKLLTLEEEINIPKVIFFLFRIFLINLKKLILRKK